MEIQGVDNWIAAQESRRTRASYQLGMERFVQFCQKNHINGYNTIVQDYRAARDSESRQKLQQWIDQWNDVVQGYTTYLKDHYASKTTSTYLAIIKSYLKKNRVPIDVDLPRRTCTTYPKEDLKRETIRLVISRSSTRNKAIWLMLCESGIRPDTLTQIRWWWIKEDYLAARVPMMIRIPQQYVKDYVGDRWSFIGSDGYDALRLYLNPRLPLHDDDYVFVREPPKVRQKRPLYIPLWQHRDPDPEPPQALPFTSSNLSSTFSYIVKALKLDSGLFGKPGKIRLYCLKNWFRNHCKADYGYVMFWMLRSTQTDSHYVSRDPEDHRARYRDAYPELRVMEAPIAIADAHREIEQQLQKRDQEIQELQGQVEKLNKSTELWRNFIENNKQNSQNPVQQLLQVIEMLSKNDPNSQLNIKTLDFPEKKKARSQNSSLN